MLVLVGERFVCVKLIGRANFTSSIDFKTLVNELRLKGFNYFVLELSECLLMDSTFLGVLAGFGLKMNGAAAEQAGQTIELLNPNPRITELLESLGVLHLFKVREGAAPLECVRQLAQAPLSPTKEEVTRACLEAHQTLMQISPDNAARFKDVAAFLAEDLKRLRAET
jgi:anti-anti-sigma regulatory factor